MRRTTLLKLIGIFSAVRGYNIVIVCLAQYLAAIFVLSHKPWREVIFDNSLLMLVIAGALAIAGGYIINGFYDKEKDLINKPTKTMIDHLVSQNTKLTLYFLLNFLSVIVASYVSFRAVIFFLLILIKEFIKDLQNIKGDLAHNYATIPVVYGESFSKKLITLSVVLCTLPIYVLLNYFSIGNLTYFLWFMLIYLCIFVCLLWRSKDQKHYALLHNMLKLILVAGIFSVALTVK